MVTHCIGYRVRHCDPGGEPVKQGWAFIAVGVGSAAWFQHLDSYVLGGMFVLLGLIVLSLKGDKK